MIPYPEHEPDMRLGGLRRAMGEYGLSSLLVFSRQWKSECIHYVSNYKLIGPEAFAVIPLDAEPVLFISEAGDIDRAKNEGWIDEVRILCGECDDSPIELAGAYGNKSGIVGLEIMNARQYGALEKHIGGGIVNALPLVDAASKIKSPWERELMRFGGGLADLGFRAELAAARPGLREFELAAEINCSMMAAGADDNFQMFSAGKNLDCMHVPRDNITLEGDLLLAEITPFVGSFNYAVQLCRTVKIGGASQLEKEKYGILVEALEESLKLVKPGVKIKEIALKMNSIIGAAGYEKYCHPPYMRSRGHNFGLGQFELTDDNDDILRPGMAMVVHPNQMIPEIGYLACGETVIVTETGSERLSKLPPKLYETEVSAL